MKPFRRARLQDRELSGVAESLIRLFRFVETEIEGFHGVRAGRGQRDRETAQIQRQILFDFLERLPRAGLVREDLLRAFFRDDRFIEAADHPADASREIDPGNAGERCGESAIDEEDLAHRGQPGLIHHREEFADASIGFLARGRPPLRERDDASLELDQFATQGGKVGKITFPGVHRILE